MKAWSDREHSVTVTRNNAKARSVTMTATFPHSLKYQDATVKLELRGLSSEGDRLMDDGRKRSHQGYRESRSLEIPHPTPLKQMVLEPRPPSVLPWRILTSSLRASASRR